MTFEVGGHMAVLTRCIRAAQPSSIGHRHSDAMSGKKGGTLGQYMHADVLRYFLC